MLHSANVQVTVMLPAKNLTSVNVTGAFDLIIGSGFSAQTFVATSFGAATVSATNITATRCILKAFGCVPATCCNAGVRADPGSLLRSDTRATLVPHAPSAISGEGMKLLSA